MLRRFKGSVKENCELCGRESEDLSSFLPLCPECIRGNPDKSLEIAGKVHAGARKEVGLIPDIPQHPKGVECPYCANNCWISEGGRGYCNLSRNKRGYLVRQFGTPKRAVGVWYRILTRRIVSPLGAVQVGVEQGILSLQRHLRGIWVTRALLYS